MDEVASTLRRGLLWLERDQERDGHWSDRGGLPRLTATSQSLRAFVACGFSEDHPTVSRAVGWLTRSDIAAGINHYFWRLGALSELHRSGVPEHLIEHDIRSVRTAIDDGVRMDRRLNYRAFLLDCLANIGSEPDWVQPYLDHVRDSLTTGEVDITPTLWAFVALERMGGAGGVELDIEKITYSLRETNGCYHLNGSVAETSYFVLNCTRSDALSGHPELQPFIHGAVRWLISRQRPAGLWPTEQPLYSGDPQPPAYYTALSCRALAAYLERYRPRSLAQIAIPDWRFRRRLTKIALRATFSGIACLALVAVGTLLIPGNIGRLVTITGVIGTLLGAVAFVWDAQGKLAHRRTR